MRIRTRLAILNVLLVIGTLIAGVLAPTNADAQSMRRRRPRVIVPPSPGVWQKNMVGVQLGPWFSDDLSKDIDAPGFRLSSVSTAFHIEFFYQPHLRGPLYLDVNFGAVSRGDIRITDTESPGDASTFGDATLYPIGLGLQFVPFARKTGLRLQPVVRAGASVIVGTERLQSVINTRFQTFVGLSSESRVSLGYYAGGGLLWVLGSQFALTANAKYQYAEFSKELFGVRDYSGVQVMIGGVYLYR